MARINTGMDIRTIPVSQMKPAKYNPRKDLKPGDPAYEKIKRSLTDFGYVDPIIWNEVTGNIVGGHQRYKVLTAEGATELELGTYPTEEIAAAVYNLAAAIFFGEFRRENILDDTIKLSVFDTEKVMKRCHKAITTRRLNVKTERYTDYLASMRA